MTTPRHILFPTDFSTCAERAYLHAVLLARRFDATLHVLHVAEPDDPEWDWTSKGESAPFEITEAEIYADLGIPLPPPEALSALDRIDVDMEEVESRRPAEAIVDYADEEEIDLIVMGTHGRKGWRRGMLGSVAESVARHAPCPVLTVRSRSAEDVVETSGDPPWPPQRVLLAVDTDNIGDGKLPPLPAQWAALLASAYNARLDIVYARSPRTLSLAGHADSARARTDSREVLVALSEALQKGTDSLSVQVTVRDGEAVDVVEAIAREDRTHLLVVGSHGRRGPRRVLLGSVAEALMRAAPCPTLIVRERRRRSGVIVPGAEAEALVR